METKNSFWDPCEQPNVGASDFTPHFKASCLRGSEAQHRCPPQGGSSGKGTTLNHSSDVDMVPFLSCFSSFQDQALLRGSIISLIEEKLTHCSRSLAYNITLAPRRETTRVPRSLSFQVQARRSSEIIRVDVLPAFNALSKDSDGSGGGKGSESGAFHQPGLGGGLGKWKTMGENGIASFFGGMGLELYLED